MKVGTLGVLAGLGMVLTSVSVWSLTKPTPAIAGDPALVASTSGETPLVDLPAGTPSFTAGSTLMVEGRLGHARLVADQESETFMFLNVTGDGTGAGAGTPVNLAIVVDRSGSMKGKRLENALDAARGMVRRLRDNDVVSVISYSTDTETVVAPTTIDGFSRERVLSSLSSIEAQGDTCISCGIDAGMAALRQRNGMVTRMLLLTDGEATAGVRDTEGFRRIASGARSSNVTISSIGVDVEYNERVLSTLALESNGKHYFAENAASLPAIFDQELESLKNTIARDAEIAVDLAPGVEVEQVFDRAFRREGNKLLVSMGNFAGSEQKTVLVRLRIPRGSVGERPVADVRMNYDDLVKRDRGSCEGKLSTVLVADKSQASALDGLVAARIGRSQTASVVNEANDLFRKGDVAAASRKLEDALAQNNSQSATAASAAPKTRVKELDDDFERQRQALNKAKDNLDSAAKKPSAAPPAQSRDGKAGLKKNAELANPFGF